MKEYIEKRLRFLREDWVRSGYDYTDLCTDESEEKFHYIDGSVSELQLMAEENGFKGIFCFHVFINEYSGELPEGKLWSPFEDDMAKIDAEIERIKQNDR